MKIYKIKFSGVLLTLLAVFPACFSSVNQNSNKIFMTGVNLLYGPVSVSDLFKEFPSWKERYDAYVPEPSLIDSLSHPVPDLKAEIFFGTWCGDSKREVPHFLKISDKSGFILPENIKLWAVDRNKELDNGLTEEKNIKKVATFIIYFRDKELGRIIESPNKASLEENIFLILKGVKNKTG